ncbi:MAG TPA: DNA repair protein RecO [Desulfonatronum sp.]|nr:DNA repair protein RecO [Desulfonatronum sp.]
MHRELTGEGLVFKIGRFREHDCWVRFLSPALGLVTAFAFGGSKSRRRFGGCLDILNRVLFTIRFFPNKDYYCLEEGTLLQGFARLRRDLGRQGLAANCMQFVQALHVDAQSAPAIHALLLETLEVLDQSDQVSRIFPQFFRAKMCFDQGFAPQFGVCASCGKSISAMDATLALDMGRFFCPRCAPASAKNLRVGAEAHASLQRIAATGPRQWDDSRLSRSACADVYRVVDGYVQRHLGLRWKQGRFTTA